MKNQIPSQSRHPESAPATQAPATQVPDAQIPGAQAPVIQVHDAEFPKSTGASPADIGERIRTARNARGWTQDQLAAAVGVSRSAVAQWETGRSGQITGNLTRIAAVLETHVELLMFGADNTVPSHAATGDELAVLRLYRACSPDDRQMLLRTARRLART